MYRGNNLYELGLYDIVDKNGKKVFTICGDDYLNNDALKKAVLRKKASSKGVPQHRRFWE
jgi:hypothetical protein